MSLLNLEVSSLQRPLGEPGSVSALSRSLTRTQGAMPNGLFKQTREYSATENPLKSGQDAEEHAPSVPMTRKSYQASVSGTKENLVRGLLCVVLTE